MPDVPRVEQFAELVRLMLRERLTDDAEGRRFALACLDALVKDNKLVELCQTPPPAGELRK